MTNSTLKLKIIASPLRAPAQRGPPLPTTLSQLNQVGLNQSARTIGERNKVRSLVARLRTHQDRFGDLSGVADLLVLLEEDAGIASSFFLRSSNSLRRSRFS